MFPFFFFFLIIIININCNFSFYRGSQGRLTIIANCVTVFKHCINKINKSESSAMGDAVLIFSLI